MFVVEDKAMVWGVADDLLCTSDTATHGQNAYCATDEEAELEQVGSGAIMSGASSDLDESLASMMQTFSSLSAADRWAAPPEPAEMPFSLHHSGSGSESELDLERPENLFATN